MRPKVVPLTNDKCYAKEIKSMSNRGNYQILAGCCKAAFFGVINILDVILSKPRACLWNYWLIEKEVTFCSSSVSYVAFVLSLFLITPSFGVSGGLGSASWLWHFQGIFTYFDRTNTSRYCAPTSKVRVHLGTNVCPSLRHDLWLRGVI